MQVLATVLEKVQKWYDAYFIVIVDIPTLLVKMSLCGPEDVSVKQAARLLGERLALNRVFGLFLSAS
jgi:hypothetical protein